MSLLFYVTHPQVQVAPELPVTEWGLSERGRERVLLLLAQPWLAGVGRVISSEETKAVQTAQLLAVARGLPLETRSGIGENDRSATGFVPPDEFEQLADAFFAHSERSVRGWERAIDAQRRIVAGLSDVLEQRDSAEPDVLVVGHGAVGTLLYCALQGLPIDRRHDQPGQGHYFRVDRARRVPLHAWRPIDEIALV